MIAIFIVGVLMLVIIWLKSIYSYWEKKGVPGPKPTWIVGNFGPNIIREKHVGDIYTDIYRRHDGHAVVGFYRMLRPCLLVRDIESLKIITSKDFASFHDNDTVPLITDPLEFGHPFSLKGEEWKEKRRSLGNALGTSKVKTMFESVTEGARHMMEYLDKEVGFTMKTLDALGFIGNYTLETVLACGYGIKINVFEKSNSRFVELEKKLLRPKTLDMYLMHLSRLFPKLSSVVQFRYTGNERSEQTLEMIRSALKYRYFNCLDNKDYLGTIAPLTAIYDEVSVLSLAAAIYIDGQVTGGLASGLLLYNLAEHPEIQEKLRREVRDYFAIDNGQLSYESIQEMSYLDACFKESVRMQTISKAQSRICTKTYTYKPSDEKLPNVVIEKGTPIVIPYYAIHNDPKYFEDPHKYKPERFLEQDSNIESYFFPWGYGPRLCPGKAFGAIQVKTSVAYLINKFELTVNRTLQQQSKIDPWMFFAIPSQGYPINFTRIDD